MYSTSCITILVLLTTFAGSFASVCDGHTGNNNIMLNEFTVFPPTVSYGESIYVRAKITPAQVIPSAQVQITAYYTTSSDVSNLTPLINISGLDLCTLASNIKCPLSATSHIFMWEFVVPQIPPGTYQIKYHITQAAGTKTTVSSCFQFAITVKDDSFDGTFRSWYSATLLGKAYFSRADYTSRTIGDALQVGPLGPLVDWDGSDLAYGTLSSVYGSGDLIPRGSFDTSGFVWGLNGVLEMKTIGSNSWQQSHIYNGNCYLGYLNKYNYSNPLLSGTFTLNWTYLDSSTAIVSGNAVFSPNSTIPPGWGVPLLFGRLGTHSIVTSNEGFLMITGSSEFCANGFCSSNYVKASNNHGISSDKLGLAISLPIAFVFIVVLIAAGLIWYVNRRKTEQEDGVFAVARKPEYGSALVVDDIIEETKGNKNLRNMMNHQYSEDEEDPSNDEDEDYESDDVSRSLSRSRSPSIRRPRSISRSRSLSRSTSRSKSRTRSISRSRHNVRRSLPPRYARDETDPGESASRASEDEYSD